MEIQSKENFVREFAAKSLMSDWDFAAGRINKTRDQNFRRYCEKRISTPVLAAARVEDGKARLYVVNDRADPVKGELYWGLYENNRRAVRGLKEITLPPYSTAVYDELEAPVGEIAPHCVLCYGFWQEYDCLSEGALLFVPQRDYVFEEPLVFVEFFGGGDEYRVELRSHVFVKGICLWLEEGSAEFSDNFFDLEPGMRKTVSVRKDRVTGAADEAEFKSRLNLISFNHLCREKGDDGP